MKWGNVPEFEIGFFSLPSHSTLFTSLFQISAYLTPADLWHYVITPHHRENILGGNKHWDCCLVGSVRLKTPLKMSSTISLPLGSLPGLPFLKTLIPL